MAHAQRYRYIELHDRFNPDKGVISFIGQDENLAVTFMYNPGEFTRRGGFAHGSQRIPGRSHPMYGGGAGDEESISFTLQMDADRGNYEKRKSQYPNGNDFEVFDALVQQDGRNFYTEGPDISQLENLRPLIDSFFQFIRTEGFSNQPGGEYGVPARIFLDLGSVFQGEIGIDNMEEGIFSMGVKLNVMKANLRIQAHVVENSNVTDSLQMERAAKFDFRPERVREGRENRVPGFRVGR